MDTSDVVISSIYEQKRKAYHKKNYMTEEVILLLEHPPADFDEDEEDSDEDETGICETFFYLDNIELSDEE